MMIDVSYIKNTGDNLQSQDSDWVLLWDSPLLEQIKALPIAFTRKFILNQYSDAKHGTSCTKFAPANALWNDMGYYPSDPLAAINRIELKSEEAWWGWPWFGWHRWWWVDILRKDWNLLNPNNEVFSFLVQFFAEEFIAYLKSWRTVVCSISVNSAYWRDVLSDGKLDALSFSTWSWHATAFQRTGEDAYTFIDSVGKKWWSILDWSTYTITEEQLRYMLDKNKTMRYDVHIFIPKKVVKMIAKDVPAGLWFSKWAETMIKYWLMTNDEKWNFDPNAPLTRWMLATVVDRMIEKWFIIPPTDTTK